MGLTETYQKIRPAVVAFTPKFHVVRDPNEPLPEFPPIFGTGFIVADGLVVTNDHVVKAFSRLPRPPDCPPDIWPVQCLLLYFIPEKGMVEIKIDVIGIFGLTGMEAGEHYYGPPIPDIAFVHVKMKDLPKVQPGYTANKIKEGCEVATAGYPMGTDTLTAPGYLHQLTPTLQKGIISAVLPFECDNPHALMINVMTQGGASGSPVFLPDSEEVIGVLYGGLEDIKKTISLGRRDGIIDPSLHTHLYRTPTNASYVVPAHYVTKVMNQMKDDKQLELPPDTPSLTELLNTAELVSKKRGKSECVPRPGQGDPAKRKIERIALRSSEQRGCE